MGSLCGFEPPLREPHITIYPDMVTARSPVAGLFEEPRSPGQRVRAPHGDRRPRFPRPEVSVPTAGASPSEGRKPRFRWSAGRLAETASPAGGFASGTLRTTARAPLRPAHDGPRRGPRTSSDRTPPRAPATRAEGRGTLASASAGTRNALVAHMLSHNHHRYATPRPLAGRTSRYRHTVTTPRHGTREHPDHAPRAPVVRPATGQRAAVRGHRRTRRGRWPPVPPSTTASASR